MPDCGSQVSICDVPIRYDTYKGCGHGCTYCFTSRKVNIKNISPGESPEALLDFIKGKRTSATVWCDWNIPIHWGGMSDPFQPVERIEKKSLRALEIFAETGYPFIVSTKNTLIIEDPYLDLIKRCNCVVQLSACSPLFDKIERGAPTYEERIKAAEILAKYKRVNIRIQPYIPQLFLFTLKQMKRYGEIGIHGIIVEGMKYTQPKVPGLIMNGRDFVYPLDNLLKHFSAIKAAAHKNNLMFYCGENRLRAISDELCCCGIEGMGWRENKANLNHALFDPKGIEFTKRQKEIGTASAFLAAHQDSLSQKIYKKMSFADAIAENIQNPYQFIDSGFVRYSDVEEETLRGELVNALNKSGLKRKDIDRHLGTNGMAGHYFGQSQWCFPTPAAYCKLQEILPDLPDMNALFNKYGIKGVKPRIYGLLKR